MNLKWLCVVFPLLPFVAHASPLDNFKIEEMPDPRTGLAYASLADLDGDGYLDVLMSYADSSNVPRLGVYHNESGTGWTHSVSDTLRISDAKPILGYPGFPDINGDGKLGLALYTGNSTSTVWLLKDLPAKGVTGLGRTSFTEITETDLALHSGARGNSFPTNFYFKTGPDANVTYGDFNSDGIPDAVAFPGYSSRSDTAIYYKSGPGGYTEIPFSTLHFWSGNIVSGDFDNDGDLDFIVTGMTFGGGFGNSNFWAFYENKNGTFIQTMLWDDYGPGYGTAMLGDIDNDGDLDIICSGRYVHTTLFRNMGVKKNAPPSIPGSARMHPEGNSLVFSWNRSTDDLTPSPGLSYNFWLRSKHHSETWKYPPYADTLTGKPFNPYFGNCGGDTSIAVDLSNLPADHYYWGVQAIDNGFAASNFTSGEFETSATGIRLVGDRPIAKSAAGKKSREFAIGHRKGFLSADGRRL